MNGGVVVWEIGNNVGIVSEIKDFFVDDGVII